MTIRQMFQILNMRRFSWITTECRYAVAVSHGRNDAFSTGSHAQYPPHPSSVYAHAPPRTMPTDSADHAIRVQRRVDVNHASSSRLVSSAPIAKANGIE